MASTQTLLALRAAAMLVLQEREHGLSGIPRLEVVEEDEETGDLVGRHSGQRYTREEWSARVRTAPRGWHGIELVYVETSEGRPAPEREGATTP